MDRRSIQYAAYGDPQAVCTLVRDTISTDVGPGEALVHWLASPINPLDINKIQGTYVHKIPVPAIGGSEAFGRVLKIGTAVSNLRAGNQVVTLSLSSPVWTDASVVDAKELFNLDPRITPREGATIIVNPTTAWHMIKMGELSKGDWIIQNSANSGVGRAVIQIAKEKGLHTINVVRSRPDIEALKAELRSLGGDLVWTEEEVAKERKAFKSKVKLALNGVGGRSCLQVAGMLAEGGLLVTYGGMSKKPHEISSTALVFNEIRAVGIAMGKWILREENMKELQRMLREIEDMYLRKTLYPPPMDAWQLEDYAKAIENSMDGKHGKQIFLMEPEFGGSKI